MKETLEELEERRKKLYRELGGLGDFRRGDIESHSAPQALDLVLR